MEEIDYESQTLLFYRLFLQNNYLKQVSKKKDVFPLFLIGSPDNSKVWEIVVLFKNLKKSQGFQALESQNLEVNLLRVRLFLSNISRNIIFLKFLLCAQRRTSKNGKEVMNFLNTLDEFAAFKKSKENSLERNEEKLYERVTKRNDQLLKANEELKGINQKLEEEVKLLSIELEQKKREVENDQQINKKYLVSMHKINEEKFYERDTKRNEQLLKSNEEVKLLSNELEKKKCEVENYPQINKNYLVSMHKMNEEKFYERDSKKNPQQFKANEELKGVNQKFEEEVKLECEKLDKTKSEVENYQQGKARNQSFNNIYATKEILRARNESISTVGRKETGSFGDNNSQYHVLKNPGKNIFLKNNQTLASFQNQHEKGPKNSDNQEIFRLTETIKSLTTQNEAMKNNKIDAFKLWEQKREEITQGYENKISELTTNLSKETEKSSQLNLNFKRLDQIHQKCFIQISLLSDSLKAMELNFKHRNDEILSLIESMSLLKNHCNMLELKLTEKSSEINRLLHFVSFLKKEHMESKNFQEKENLKISFQIGLLEKSYITTNNNLRKEITQLNESYQNEKNENEELNKRHENAQEILRIKEKTIFEMETEISTFKDKLKNTEEKKQEEKSEIENLEANYMKIKGKLKEKRGKIAFLEADLESLQKKYDSLNEKYKSLKNNSLKN